MRELLASMVVLAALTGCQTGETVKHTRTTLGEVDMSGLECRRDTPVTSAIPRTICASPAAWARFDEEARMKAEREFDEPRRNANVDKFGRGM